MRGITGDGKTLNIAGDYIAHGIRERASEIATLELGRQIDMALAAPAQPVLCLVCVALALDGPCRRVRHVPWRHFQRGGIGC